MRFRLARLRLRERRLILASYLPVHRLGSEDRFAIHAWYVKRKCLITGECHTCVAVTEGPFLNDGRAAMYCPEHGHAA